MIRIRLVTTANQEIINASEEATVREILADNDIVSLAGAVTALDGCNLTAGDIDKTLPELGVEDECVLSVVVKTANAAKATIAGSACIVTSAMKLEDLKLIKKYRPKTLNLYEGEGKEKELVFSIDVTEKSVGSMNKYGATFGPHTTQDGHATLTISVTADEKDPKEAVMEKIGVGLLKLNKLEGTFAGVIEEIKKEKADIDSCVTVQ